MVIRAADDSTKDLVGARPAREGGKETLHAWLERAKTVRARGGYYPYVGSGRGRGALVELLDGLFHLGSLGQRRNDLRWRGGRSSGSGRHARMLSESARTSSADGFAGTVTNRSARSTCSPSHRYAANRPPFATE